MITALDGEEDSAEEKCPVDKLEMILRHRQDKKPEKMEKGKYKFYFYLILLFYIAVAIEQAQVASNAAKKAISHVNALKMMEPNNLENPAASNVAKRVISPVNVLKTMAPKLQDQPNVSNVMKKVTCHVNVQKVEALAASNAVKKAIWLENAQVKEEEIKIRDNEMTMEAEMEMATRDKNQMMRTTKITNGDSRYIKHNFKNQV